MPPIFFDDYDDNGANHQAAYASSHASYAEYSGYGGSARPSGYGGHSATAAHAAHENLTGTVPYPTDDVGDETQTNRGLCADERQGLKGIADSIDMSCSMLSPRSFFNVNTSDVMSDVLSDDDEILEHNDLKQSPVKKRSQLSHNTNGGVLEYEELRKTSKDGGHHGFCADELRGLNGVSESVNANCSMLSPKSIFAVDTRDALSDDDSPNHNAKKASLVESKSQLSQKSKGDRCPTRVEKSPIPVEVENNSAEEEILEYGELKKISPTNRDGATSPTQSDIVKSISSCLSGEYADGGKGGIDRSTSRLKSVLDDSAMMSDDELEEECEAPKFENVIQQLSCEGPVPNDDCLINTNVVGKQNEAEDDDTLGDGGGTLGTLEDDDETLSVKDPNSPRESLLHKAQSRGSMKINREPVEVPEVDIPDDDSEASLMVLMRYMGCTPQTYGERKDGDLPSGKEFLFDSDDEDEHSMLSGDNVLSNEYNKKYTWSLSLDEGMELPIEDFKPPSFVKIQQSASSDATPVSPKKSGRSKPNLIVDTVPTLVSNSSVKSPISPGSSSRSVRSKKLRSAFSTTSSKGKKIKFPTSTTSSSSKSSEKSKTSKKSSDATSDSGNEDVSKPLLKESSGSKSPAITPMSSSSKKSSVLPKLTIDSNAPLNSNDSKSPDTTPLPISSTSSVGQKLPVAMNIPENSDAQKFIPISSFEEPQEQNPPRSNDTVRVSSEAQISMASRAEKIQSVDRPMSPEMEQLLKLKSYLSSPRDRPSSPSLQSCVMSSTEKRVLSKSDTPQGSSSHNLDKQSAVSTSVLSTTPKPDLAQRAKDLLIKIKSESNASKQSTTISCSGNAPEYTTPMLTTVSSEKSESSNKENGVGVPKSDRTIVPNPASMSLASSLEESPSLESELGSSEKRDDNNMVSLHVTSTSNSSSYSRAKVASPKETAVSISSSCHSKKPLSPRNTSVKEVDDLLSKTREWLVKHNEQKQLTKQTRERSSPYTTNNDAVSYTTTNISAMLKSYKETSLSSASPSTVRFKEKKSLGGGIRKPTHKAFPQDPSQKSILEELAEIRAKQKQIR